MEMDEMAIEMPPHHGHGMEAGDGINGGEEDGLYGGTAGHYGHSTRDRVQYNGYDDERDLCFEQDYSDLVEDGDGIDDIENAMDDMYDNGIHETDGPAMTGRHIDIDIDAEPKIIDLGMKGDGMSTGDDVDKLILDRINTSDLL